MTTKVVEIEGDVGEVESKVANFLPYVVFYVYFS